MGVSHIKLTKRTVNNIIKLSIVGFEWQSKTAIELFFKQYSQEYALVPVDQAEVLIFDMEHPAVKSLIEEYKAKRPIVAVTATEKTFKHFVTLRKPLDGKRLMKAIKQAIAQFVPSSSQEPEIAVKHVSNAGEKAFQDYQKRLASGRQAMADYQTVSVDRDQKKVQVRQRFQLPTTITTEARAEKANSATASNKTATAAIQPNASVVSNKPVERITQEKKPQDVKAKLSYQMVYECCGNAPDVNLYESDQRRRVFFKRNSTLLEKVLWAVADGDKDGFPVEITGLPGMLIYWPEQQQLQFDFSEDLLIPLALTRFSYQELTLEPHAELDADHPVIAAKKGTRVKSDEFIWKLALWTSKGRLDREIDPEQRMRLSKTLDFDRLLAIPHVTTMGNLWQRHSLSAIEVVKVLKIHQRYVFAFMTAAYALGAFK